MIILVTGCCGFIGGHLSEKLLKEKVIVHGIDNFIDNYNVEYKYEVLEILKKYSNFIFHQEDLLETNIINEIKPNHVYHLASIPGVRKSIENPILYVKNNIETFVKLLEDCKKNKVTKIVYASSSSVYGANEKTPFSESDNIDNIRSSYACSKKCMEIYAKYYYDVFKLPIIGLRFFTVYGPRGRPDMAPYIFLKNIESENEILQYGNGSSYRDYTYISDIIDGIYSIYNNNGKYGEIYNLGNSSPITLKDFISLCEEIINKKAIINIIETQIGDVDKTYADITKSKKDLNYDPKISLEEGLKKTYNWMLENKRI